MNISGYVHLATLKRLICCLCLREMSYRVARFHRLHCR